jgi:putative NADH-flavin reductase
MLCSSAYVLLSLPISLPLPLPHSHHLLPPLSFPTPNTAQATGNLGPALAQALQNSRFNLTILARTTSTNPVPEGVTVVRADYSSHSSLVDALKGQDVVINASPPAGSTQRALIDAALEAGVKRFLPSEFGSGSLDPRARAIVPMFEAKWEAIQYLREKESELEWTGVWTGPFFDWGMMMGFFGLDSATKTTKVFGDGKSVITTTNLKTIGEAVVRILEKPEETRNLFVTVNSFQTTQLELLEAAEKITGEKWKIEHVDVKKHLAEGNEMIAAGNFFGVMNQLQGLYFGDEGMGNLEGEGFWNEKLGLGKDSLEDSLRAALEGKQPQK